MRVSASDMQIHEPDFGAHVSGKVLYVCHKNADPDAIGSGFALQQAFGGDLGVVEDVGKAGARLADAIGARPVINPDPGDYDLVVVVDTSMENQVGGLELSRYGVVDHHLGGGLVEGAEFYIQRPVESTAEIVWEILKSNGVEASRDMALGLLVGIIADTGRFKHARAEAFRVVGELLEASGLDYGEALEVLSRMPADRSQRIAVLKAASRARVDWSEDWIVVTTEVNAFEGSAAMALVDLGADVAFAAGHHGSLYRVSGRARQSATRSGLDLAEIMRSVAAAHGGQGGGHRGAAAMEASGPSDALLRDLRALALAALEGPGKD